LPELLDVVQLPKAGARRQCRRGPGVNGLDDLAVVDALQVDRGHAEVGVAELALDHVERQALARHLDGVGVPELVRCEAAPDPGLDGELTQAAAGGRRGP
jgi:hypothetical protein